ncbi:PQQ-binding-like beta-propeller repeat protein [Anatilimnocola aggregata]|uniref:PQQ-binding-like beta-propeller repeat protein n=1 Tax=Anatilimnocola aggregata TaxID=2528021 RepID=UPI00192E712D|nr:PQQ-binding-like beta-propeller repeat protein [Anatilimnocola aggregata]
MALIAAEEQWNQYRGPNADGTSAATGLPTKWSETENVKWRAPIRGKAWSSPVVWNQQIWLTTAPADGKELFAICLDRETGKVLHDVKVFDVASPQYCHDRNSYASCTPFVEADRVYVHYGVHGTACLDTKTGKVLWTRNDLECNHHRGAGSSPIVWQDLLILTFDGFDVQYVVALDKETGKTVWKTDRGFNYGTDNGDVMKAYGTPRVVEVGGQLELVSPSAGSTAAYDPRTGKELWQVKSGGMNAAGRPVVSKDTAFIGTADGGMHLFAVKLGGRGDVTGTHVNWKLAKGYPRYASPILVDGLLYMGNEQGIITCVDAETGEVKYQNRLGGLFMSSPVYADGKLYFFAEEGICHVIKPGPEFVSLAENKLAGGFMASPAIAGKALILRTKDAVVCVAE